MIQNTISYNVVKKSHVLSTVIASKDKNPFSTLQTRIILHPVLFFSIKNFSIAVRISSENIVIRNLHTHVDRLTINTIHAF